MTSKRERAISTFTIKNKYLDTAMAILVVATFLGGVAQAADAPGGAMLVYPASYFASAQLNTAYDMVTRLPGFVFTDTNTQQRGYAGSMGNVFINGAPPASKTDVLSSVL